MSTVAATNTYSRHTGRYHKKLPVLTIHDIREFVLAYLKNEYSPSSSDHGPLPTSQNTYLHGVRIPSSHLRSPKEPHGRTMPPKSYRWLAIGKSLRHEGASHRAEKQALRDIEKMKQLFLDARVPRGAIEQIEASVRDFSRLDRFSRVRTKLVKVGAWQALAARLLNDQGLIIALWPPRVTGFLMPDAEVDVARRNLQDVGAAIFLSIRSVKDFEVRNTAKLQQRLPGLKALKDYRVEGYRMDAFSIAEHAGKISWGHQFREYMAVEDLYDIGPGKRLVKKVSFERECAECTAKHHINVQLVIGPEAELPRPGELPAYRSVVPEEEEVQAEADQGVFRIMAAPVESVSQQK